MHLKKYVLILFIALVTGFSSLAQNIVNDSVQKQKKVDFTLMPFLSYNRNLDFMFGVIPMVMYRLNPKDSISPKSISGVTGIYTTNKSYIIGLFNRLYLKEDNYRATLYFFNGDINSQFFLPDFTIESFYNYGTKATVFGISLQKLIVKDLYGGVTYSYARYTTNFEDDVLDPTYTKNNGLELNLLFDTRDDVYYPFHGGKLTLAWANYGKWLGNEITSNKVKTVYNRYFGVRKQKDVIAARFAGTFGLGDLAFEQQTVVGGADIRGYSKGKYRGDGVLGLQGEYRLNFENRMGVVGFVGLATLYGSENEDFNWDLLPGIGAGYRYRAFKQTRFNIGLDAAVGKDDWGVYFRIGEAF